MRLPFFGDDNTPRPPLAGRLVGLAVGVLLLAGAVYVAIGVVEALIQVVVPLIVVGAVYRLMFRGRSK